ncbi:MAG: carotenoid biosynthesis protein [Gemmatimonadota bacterium]
MAHATTQDAPARLHERKSAMGRSYLWVYAFTLPALLGYWTYGLHPERLAGSELALRIYPFTFPWFARLHIIFGAAVLFAALFKVLRTSWLPVFASVALLSFMAEHIGTGYGVPFGGYGYTGLLGLKVGGRVPALIPVSWFLMALPAWLMARTAFPEGRLRRVLLGASWLVAWDLALDPAMSFLTSYWRWAEPGTYYGMPWVNLFGWLTTGLVLMAAIEMAATRVALGRVGSRWAAGYFFAILAMPVGMLIAAGVWGAVATSLAGLLLCGVVTWREALLGLLPRRPSMTPEAVEA